MIVTDVPATGVYFLTYEAFQDFMNPSGTSDLGILYSVIGGGLAGVSMWAMCMPADVLKSRLQTGILKFITFFSLVHLISTVLGTLTGKAL